MRKQRWTHRILKTSLIALAWGAVHVGAPRALSAQALDSAERSALLALRDSVWRSWYTNDQARLKALIPADLVAINPEGPWQSRDECLASAQAFAAHHGRLVSLDFPHTKMQVYGPVAILYSDYALRLVVDGKEQAQSGRASEIFVRRGGHWVNSGWHLDHG